MQELWTSEVLWDTRLHGSIHRHHKAYLVQGVIPETYSVPSSQFMENEILLSLSLIITPQQLQIIDNSFEKYANGC